MKAQTGDLPLLYLSNMDFFFARTHSFSIEQQKATNDTCYMKNTIQSEHPQLI